MSKLRNLVLPEAIKTTSDIITYAKTDYDTNTNINLKGARIHRSGNTTKYIIYTSYNQADKNLYIKVIDHSLVTSNTMENIVSEAYEANSCGTNPSSGDPEIYIPSGYLHYKKQDYISVISTGLQSGKCQNIYGKYEIYVSDYTNSTTKLSRTLNNNTGVIPFYNPNLSIKGESLGLPTFLGYTKVVDVSFHLTKNSKPKVLALVYYEDK